MNSTGFTRGYMVKNMSAKEFIKVSAEALALMKEKSLYRLLVLGSSKRHIFL